MKPLRSVVKTGHQMISVEREHSQKTEDMCVVLCRFQQAELVHGRTAMTAVAGILFPAVRHADFCCVGFSSLSTYFADASREHAVYTRLTLNTAC